jgi:hypothetical protein
LKPKDISDEEKYVFRACYISKLTCLIGRTSRVTVKESVNKGKLDDIPLDEKAVDETSIGRNPGYHGSGINARASKPALVPCSDPVQYPVTGLHSSLHPTAFEFVPKSPRSDSSWIAMNTWTDLIDTSHWFDPISNESQPDNKHDQSKIQPDTLCAVKQPVSIACTESNDSTLTDPFSGMFTSFPPFEIPWETHRNWNYGSPPNNGWSTPHSKYTFKDDDPGRYSAPSLILNTIDGANVGTRSCLKAYESNRSYPHVGTVAETDMAISAPIPDSNITKGLSHQDFHDGTSTWGTSRSVPPARRNANPAISESRLSNCSPLMTSRPAKTLDTTTVVGFKLFIGWVLSCLPAPIEYVS